MKKITMKKITTSWKNVVIFFALFVCMIFVLPPHIEFLIKTKDGLY